MPLTTQTLPAPTANPEPTLQSTPAHGVEPSVLSAVLQTIRRDSLIEAERYLEESQVPFGGE
jgi:hypothetical protein